MTFKSGKRAARQLRAIGKVAKRSCAPVDNVATGIDFRHRTLIDSLEPRLLFSAEHPLGVFLNPAELTDQHLDAADEQLVSDTLEVLHQLRLEAANDATLAPFERASGASGASTADADAADAHLTVDELPFNDDAASPLLLDDGAQPLIIIDVTTTDDRVDATDTSSFAAFNYGAGGDGEVSLREAIIVANADSAVDIIRLPDGTYSLTLDTGQRIDDVNLEGDVDLDGTYSIQGQSEDGTVIEQAVDGRRVFELRSGDVTFEDLTIKDGSAVLGRQGGGVYVNLGTTATFENVTFENNTTENTGGAIFTAGQISLTNVNVEAGSADLGGGIYINGTGTAVISSSTIANNTADDGGGIYNQGRITLLDSVVQLNEVNEVTFGDTARGGGIYNEASGSVNIERSVIRENVTNGNGGGMHNLGTLTMSDSAFIGNEAAVFGGGLDNYATATLDRISIWGNSADSIILSTGGGIFNGAGGNLTLTQSIVANNSSTILGAAIHSVGSALISNSTIVDNDSASGSGAGFVFRPGSTSPAPTLSLNNSIVANNIADGASADVKGSSPSTVDSGGFNLIETGELFNQTSTDIIGADPLLGEAVLNADKITVSVDPSSPIINSGSTASSGELSADGVTVIGDTPDIGGGVSNQQGGMTFWSADSGAIYRSNIEHTFNQKIIEWDTAPLDLQVDVQTNRIYWLDSGSQAIHSANFDGSDIREERLVDEDAVAFTIDRDHQRFFVAVQGATPQILQYFQNGTVFATDAEQRQGQLVRALPNLPTDIDLDADSDMLYWSAQANDDQAIIAFQETRPMGVDPDVPYTVIISATSGPMQNPYALVVDDVNDVVYWTDPVGEIVYSYNPASTPTINGLPFGVGVPQAVGLSTQSNVLLVANENSNIQFIGNNGSVDLPETATHLAVAAMAADELSPVPGAPTVVSNTGLSLVEGQAATLSSAELQYVDDDTSANKLVYSLQSGSTEIEIQRNGSEVTSFSQQDIDKGRISFVHSGAHVGVEQSWILLLEFTASDDNGSQSPVSFNVLVANSDDAPQLLLTQPLEVQQGLQSIVTLDNINAVDDDTTNADLQFSVSVSIDYEFLLDGVVASSFTKQNIINGDVTVSHFGVQAPSDYPIAIQVQDASSTSATESLILSVTPAPIDPTFNPLSLFTVAEGGTVSLDNVEIGVADSDTVPSNVNFTLTNVVGGELLVAGNVELTFTLADLQTPGTVGFIHDGEEPSVDSYVELTISDEQVTPLALRIDFLVTPVNDNAPVAQDHLANTRHGVSLTTLAGAQASILFDMSDVDEQPGETFSVVIIDDPAGTLSVDNATGTFEYTPPPSIDLQVADSDLFRYQIRDSAGNLSNIATVDITIAALQAPDIVDISGVPDVVILERDVLGLTLPDSVFNSPEGAVPLTLTVTGAAGAPLPAWISFDPITRTLSGIPDDADKGLLQIDVIATDTNGLDSAALSFQIDVQNINQQPVIGSVSSTSVSENVAGGIVGAVIAVDADSGDTLQYAVSGDSRFEMDNNVLKLRDGIALDFEQDATLSVDIEASDGNGGIAIEAITVSVIDENDAPVLLSQLPDQVLRTSDTLVIGVGRFSDQDNDPLVYSLTTASSLPLPDWINFNALTTELSVGVVPATERVEQLILNVADAQGDFTQMLFEVRFTPDPVDPVFASTSQVSVNEGGRVALDNTLLNVVDSDTDANNVVFSLTNAVGGEIRVAGDALPTFTLADLLTPGRVEFVHAGAEPSSVAYVVLTIDDEQMTPEPLRIDFLVVPVNDNEPVAQDHSANTRHGASLITLADGETSLLFNMSDSDEQPGQTFSVVVVNEPAGTLIVDGANGTFEYTPPPSVNVGVEANDSFSYQIRDGAGNLSNIATVDITIAALQAPVIVDASGVSDVVISELEAFSTTFPDSLFNSPEGAVPLTLTVTSTAGAPLPTWISFDPLTRTLSGNPNDIDTGVLQIDVIATDTNGLDSVPLAFQVDVQNINQQPLIVSVSATSISENVQGGVVGIVNASDADAGDTLEYAVIGDGRFEMDGNVLTLRDGMALNFEREPALAVDVEVRDNNGGVAVESLTIDVLDENDAPIVQTQASDQLLTAVDTVLIGENSFSDQDNDDLTFSLSLSNGQALPDWIEFDPVTTELRLGTAPLTEVREQLVLTAVDGRGGSVQMLFDVNFVPEPQVVPEPEVPEPVISLPEPALGAASFIESPLEFSILAEFDRVDQGAIQRTTSEPDPTVSESGVFASIQERTSEDSIEPIASVSIDSLDRMLGYGASLLSGADDGGGQQSSVLRDNVISEYLATQQTTQLVTPADYLRGNVFDDTVNIAALFSAAIAENPEMYANLADEFNEQQEEVDSQIAASRIVVGSSVTVTSGLSVGYILYLLRGGAIMSSMLTSLPAWRFVDPLPILSTLDGTLDNDQESLQSIVSNSSGK